MATRTETQLSARDRSAKHRNDMQLMIDGFAKQVTTGLPTYAEAVIKRAREEVQKPFEAFLAKAESIRASGRYSPDGEQAELQLAARGMLEKLDALKAGTVAKIETQLAEKRAAALKPKTQSDPALALVRELKLRETRDYLRRVDPLQLKVRLRQAVTDGASTDLLDALEGAPSGFPIAPAELVHEARNAIAERDHPELGELASLKRAYEYLLGVGEQAVLAASGGDAVALHSHAAATPDSREPYTLGGTPAPTPEVTR